MKTIVLIMQRASLAQGLMGRLGDDPALQLYFEPDYVNADAAIRGHLAQGALVEIGEDGPHTADYCLALCRWLREAVSGCKLIVMCPESQPQAVEQVVAAKRGGQIDDFVFYDVSLDYLVACLQAL